MQYAALILVLPPRWVADGVGSRSHVTVVLPPPRTGGHLAANEWHSASAGPASCKPKTLHPRRLTARCSGLAALAAELESGAELPSLGPTPSALSQLQAQLPGLSHPEESDHFAPSHCSLHGQLPSGRPPRLGQGLEGIEGCNVLEKIDESEYGKFAWVH